VSAKLRLFALLALLSCLWAPVNLMVNWALDAGFSPAGIGLVRWSGIAVLFAVMTRVPAVAYRLNLRRPSRRDFALCVLLGVFLTGPAHLLYYIALRHTQAVEGTVFNTTAPLWTAFFAGIILHEHVGPRRWLALAIGCVGAYVTAIGFAVPDLHAKHAALNGLYLLGTIMESVTGVFLAALIRRSSGLTVFGAETIGMASVFLIAPLLFPVAAPLHVPPLALGWIPLVYLILFAGAFAFGAWSTIVEKTPLSLMVLSLAVQPPVAAVIGYFARGEKVSANAAMGAVVVFVALVIAVYEPAA